MISRKMKDSPDVNIGLIGCGGVVESLHLPVLASIPDLKIRWVCDSSADRARRLARNWDVRDAFGHIEDCCDVDAVLVATPVGTRQEILGTTTARGWHALCEKPFAVNVSQHLEMLECAARKGVKLSGGYMRRYYWAVEQARKMVRSRMLGPLREVIASESAQLERTGVDLSSYRNSAQSSGGGVLFETGCHLLDQVFSVSKAERVEVRECTQKTWNDYEVETVASGVMTLETGQVAALRFSVSGVRSVYQGITLRCELGDIRLRLDPAKGLEVLLGQCQSSPLDLPHPRTATHQQHVLTAFRREWLHFLEIVRTAGDWDLRRETGLLTSDVIMQCGELAKSSCLAVRR
jgi:predicted dehydrogenase